MPIDVTSLSSDVQDFVFKHGAAEARISIDLDAMTEKFYRGVGQRQVARMKDRIAKTGVDDKKLPDMTEEELGKKLADDGGVSLVAGMWEDLGAGVEEDKRLRADMLSHGVLISWDVTSNGEPLPPTEENLLEHLSARALQALWDFCRDQTRTVTTKKETEPDEQPQRGLGSFSRAK